MPQMSDCIGSIEFALASIANVPASRARARKALRSSSLRMVWYLARSTGSFRAASARAEASEIGVPLRLAALSLRSPVPGLPGALLAPAPAGEGGAGASPVIAGAEVSPLLLLPTFASIADGS